MAGFEVVVRPMVLPNIRPTPSRLRAIEEDPEKGKAVITGGSGKLFQLSYSYSGTATQVNQIEVKRRFDVDRVYQSTGSGISPGVRSTSSSINHDNYVDVERVKSVWFADGTRHDYATPPPRDNVEVMARDLVRKA